MSSHADAPVEHYQHRAQREREMYNRGLRRSRYQWVLEHAHAYSRPRRLRVLRASLAEASGRDVLEIGSTAWRWWLDLGRIRPRRTVCINIAEAELALGRSKSVGATIKPEFRLMDAHALRFPDAHFDFVFGDAVLHHLELERALPEIARVLKPGGRIVFSEPLGINPAGKLVRRLTPHARTRDEQPFRCRELAALRRHFTIAIDTYEFISVPAGVVSRFLYARSRNPLMWAADRIDQLLQRVAPPAKWLYRNMTLVGTVRPDRR